MTTSQRLALILFVCTVLGLTHYFIRPTPNPTFRTGVFNRPYRTQINGRWKDTHASLGLAPLPDSAVLPPLTSPPHRKRSVVLQAKQTYLHFTEDALDAPHASLAEIAESFRALALLEKEAAGDRARGRVASQGRRPLSWTRGGQAERG